MNTKVKGNLLLNADLIAPETSSIGVYATFSDGLTRQTKREISLAINYGSEMLQIYEMNRNNLHVVNVVEMLEKMEEVFKKFDCERFEVRRGR